MDTQINGDLLHRPTSSPQQAATVQADEALRRSLLADQRPAPRREPDHQLGAERLLRDLSGI